MSRFITNVLKLGSATAIAQLLGILLMPVITRLYSPADFGINQIYLSIVLIFGTLSCFSYHLSIILPESDKEAAHIVVLCFLLTIIVSIISGLGLWIVSDWLSVVFNAPEFSQYIIFIPFGVFSYGFSFVLFLWLTRKVRFGTIAISKVASTLTNKFVQIGYGLLSASPLGLIIGSILNDAVFNVFMLKGIKRDLEYFRNFSFSEMKMLMIRYKKFPIFASGSSLAEIGSLNISSFMLAFYFSPIIVGFYALAYAVVKMPVKLIGNSIYNVFFQKASEEKMKTGYVSNVVQDVHRRLVSVGLFPFLVLAIIGQELFVVIFGADWSNAGLYAEIIAPWLFIFFISDPKVCICNVLEKQDINFAFNLIILITGFIALFIGGNIGDPVIALSLFSIFGVFSWGLRDFYIINIAGVDIKDSIFIIMKFFLVGCVISIPLIIGKFLQIEGMILIILAIFLTIIYYIIIIFEDAKLKDEFFRYIGVIKQR